MTMLRMMPALFLAGSLALATGCDGGGEDGGDGGSGGDDRASVILGLDGDAAAGANVFSTAGCNIEACHGADGETGSAPSLSSLVSAAMDDRLVDSLLNGRGSMPAQSSLSDQQLADVLAYLNEDFG